MRLMQARYLSELGFLPAESFISGLNKTVDWYLENAEWWQSILDGSYKQQRFGLMPRYFTWITTFKNLNAYVFD